MSDDSFHNGFGKPGASSAGAAASRDTTGPFSRSALLSSTGAAAYSFSNGLEGPRKFPDEVARRSVQNGDFQEIYWLGTGGFLIANRVDREILLLDPWTSYCSFWLRDIPTAKVRPLNFWVFHDKQIAEVTANANLHRGLGVYERSWTAIIQQYLNTQTREIGTLNNFLNELRAINEQSRSNPQPNEYYGRENAILRMQDLAKLHKMTTESCKRLCDLANVIRCAVDDGTGTPNNGYQFTGILLSHMHFDHAEDVAQLLSLLCADPGPYQDAINFMEFGTLRGRPLYYRRADGAVIDKLPTIYCDRETQVYLQTMYFGSHPSYTRLPFYNTLSKEDKREFKQQYEKKFSGSLSYWSMYNENRLGYLYGENNLSAPKWREITTSAGRSVYYVDSTNEFLAKKNHADRTPPAGTRLDALTVGSFSVTPYVWDHMNTGSPFEKFKDVADNQSAGSYERLTAFMIQRANATGAKRTFIVGSAGEMGFIEGTPSRDYTKDCIADQSPRIETDILIQAIQGKYHASLADFTEQVKAAWRYVQKNISIKDAVIFSHWETFAARTAVCLSRISPELPVQADFETDIRSDMRIVNENLGFLTALAETWTGPGENQFKALLDLGRIYILGRIGRRFEFDMPTLS